MYADVIIDDTFLSSLYFMLRTYRQDKTRQDKQEKQDKTRETRQDKTILFPTSKALKPTRTYNIKNNGKDEQCNYILK